MTVTAPPTLTASSRPKEYPAVTLTSPPYPPSLAFALNPVPALMATEPARNPAAFVSPPVIRTPPPEPDSLVPAERVREPEVAVLSPVVRVMLPELIPGAWGGGSGGWWVGVGVGGEEREREKREKREKESGKRGEIMSAHYKQKKHEKSTSIPTTTRNPTL